MFFNQYLNKKVKIRITNYGTPVGYNEIKGVMTNINDNFIELNNNTIVAMRYVETIEII